MCPPRVPEPRPRIGRSPRRNSARTGKRHQPRSASRSAISTDTADRPYSHSRRQRQQRSLAQETNGCRTRAGAARGPTRGRSDLVDRRAKADGGLQIPPRTDSAIRRHRRLGLRPLGALGALARSTRCQRPAMPLGSAQLPWSGRCAASRLACARRRGGASPTAPGCAAARCIRALPPCWRARRAYAAPPAQPAGRQDGGPRKQSWPDPLRRRQESPAIRHYATAPVQGSKRWERNVLPGQGILGPSWHTPSASHASNSAWCRDQITARQTGTSCCCVAVFCCCTRPVNGGLRISNLSV
jgi:hypothetical protein